MKSKSPALVCALMALLALARPAWATDRADLSVALKTLPLLTKKIASPAPVAIIFDPASTESKTDAQAIKAAFDEGIEAPGDIALKAELVSTTELSKLSGTKIAFLAQEVPAADFENISAAASAAGVLTVCTDLDCVKNDKCVLGVISGPQVEVYYSPVAAGKAGISFASAFTMLAKQVGGM